MAKITRAEVEHVARLALAIFDQTRAIHGLTDREREWLEYAALMHDLGSHISYARHHRHSYYLIKNGDLRGFEPEEIEVIAPVLETLRGLGMDLVGPLPADTLFTRGVLAGSDAQLAMYHDQGLAVLKYAAFDEGINVTLGLPIVRTSVDHGTALELAGTGRASADSLVAAINAAIDMSRGRN